MWYFPGQNVEVRGPSGANGRPSPGRPNGKSAILRRTATGVKTLRGRFGSPDSQPPLSQLPRLWLKLLQSACGCNGVAIEAKRCWKGSVVPELPEVETMRRGIAAVVGCQIDVVERPRCRLKPITITPSYRHWRRRVVGRTITGWGGSASA